MYGFEAISTANGWTMALSGTLIVFSGLTILSIVISQVHKILLIPANFREMFSEKSKTDKKNNRETSSPKGSKIFTDLESIYKAYKPLADNIGKSFQLADLYRIAREKDFIHPHLAIKRLWEAGIIVPKGNGSFMWNKERG